MYLSELAFCYCLCPGVGSLDHMVGNLVFSILRPYDNFNGTALFELIVFPHPSVHLSPHSQRLLDLGCSWIPRGFYLKCRCPGPTQDLLNQNSGGEIRALAIFSHSLLPSHPPHPTHPSTSPSLPTSHTGPWFLGWICFTKPWVPWASSKF